MFQNQSKLSNGNTLTVGGNSSSMIHLSPSMSDVHNSSKVLLKQDSTISCNSIQSQADRMLSGSPRSSSNRKGFRQLLHQDSMRSFKSVQSQEPCTCAITKESSCAGAGSGGANENSTGSAAHHVIGGNLAPERTPFDILCNMEPTLILETLQKSIALHKQTMGTRHRCTPSTRLKHCAHHCVQILCARMLTVMCHGSTVQHRIANDGQLKILVDALDPNHDPVGGARSEP